MMHFVTGGDWGDGVDAGFFAWTAQVIQRKRELIPFYKFDTEGLPDRWKQIVAGNADWAWNERTKRILLEKLESRWLEVKIEKIVEH